LAGPSLFSKHASSYALSSIVVVLVLLKVL